MIKSLSTIRLCSTATHTHTHFGCVAFCSPRPLSSSCVVAAMGPPLHLLKSICRHRLFRLRISVLLWVSPSLGITATRCSWMLLSSSNTAAERCVLMWRRHYGRIEYTEMKFGEKGKEKRKQQQLGNQVNEIRAKPLWVLSIEIQVNSWCQGRKCDFAAQLLRSCDPEEFVFNFLLDLSESFFPHFLNRTRCNRFVGRQQAAR